MRKLAADKSNLEHGAELTGLGAMAVPALAGVGARAKPGGLLNRFATSGVGKHMLTHHSAYDAAGLGILAAPTVYHLGKKMFGGNKPKTASIDPDVLYYFYLNMGLE